MGNEEKNKLSILKKLLAGKTVLDKEEVYKHLKSYICSRFKLEEATCATDDILELAEISLEKRDELSDSDSEEGAPDLCSGASSALSKKILLLLSIEKKLHIEFLPEEIPNIRTVKDLCEQIMVKMTSTKDKPAAAEFVDLSDSKTSNAGIKDIPFDIEKIRSDFPILKRTVAGRTLIYLDNAATTQLPSAVIKAVYEFYENYNANVYRSLHFLNRKTTVLLEETREKVQRLINATNTNEIIFTKGATESINTVVSGYGDAFIREGDEVIVTEMEHHSNLIPYQMLCKKKKAVLKVLPFDNRGELMLDVYERLLSDKTKIVAVTHVSNVLGTTNPLKRIIEMAHRRGIPVLVDAAQSIRHGMVDVSDLDCDFLCFSGHKMFSPSGTGVLYGKKEWLDKISPLSYGGGMIATADLFNASFKEIPYKFEAGTYNTGGIIGLGAAITYLENIGFENIEQYEKALMDYLVEKLSSIAGLKFIGNPEKRTGVVSFVIEDIPSDDIAIILDEMGIAVRSGHHCAIPVLKHYGIESCIRVSPAFYNTKKEIDTLIEVLHETQNMAKKEKKG